MTVPIELLNLTRRIGHLSPYLAVGWKIGTYVAEYFDGLRDVRLAAAEEGDAACALSYLCHVHDCHEEVTVAGTPRPWDFLSYHPATGTVLQFVLVRKQVELSRYLKSLEPCLAGDKPDLVKIYRTGLDLQVEFILNSSLESFCMIHRRRYRSLHDAPPGIGAVFCRRCGNPTPIRESWEVEGQICCRTCSGLELSWIRSTRRWRNR